MTLDGTNNATERAIGWWVKERYRTMRTYRRKESVLNVCNLIFHLGSNSHEASLAELFSDCSRPLHGLPCLTNHFHPSLKSHEL